jgi:hypothetical protein
MQLGIMQSKDAKEKGFIKGLKSLCTDFANARAHAPKEVSL